MLHVGAVPIFCELGRSSVSGAAARRRSRRCQNKSMGRGPRPVGLGFIPNLQGGSAQLIVEVNQLSQVFQKNPLVPSKRRKNSVLDASYVSPCLVEQADTAGHYEQQLSALVVIGCDAGNELTAFKPFQHCSDRRPVNRNEFYKRPLIHARPVADGDQRGVLNGSDVPAFEFLVKNCNRDLLRSTYEVSRGPVHVHEGHRRQRRARRRGHGGRFSAFFHGRNDRFHN